MTVPGIVGRPTSGVRYAFERGDDTEAAFVYRGFVHLPDQDYPAVARVDRQTGAVSVEVQGGEGDLAKTAAALLRAGTKAELAAGNPLPRKIVRWRS